MTTKERIKKNEQAIKVLEAIQHYETMINTCKNSMKIYLYLNDVFYKKLEHKIDIYQRCIKRLEERLTKIERY